MPALLGIPNEILFLIAGELDSTSLCNLRLASRNLNDVALPALSTRCFETRYVMLQQHSLENLIEISRHRIFGPALKNLTICIDHLAGYPEDTRYWADDTRHLQEGGVDHGSLDRNLKGTEEEAVVDRQAYDLLVENQKFMMESGLNITYLAQVMATLPNLETVVVDDAFQPWGTTTLIRQAGLLPLTNAMESFDSIEFVEQALRAIVLAIVASNISLYELDIAAGRLNADGIRPSMLVFPQPVLRHIRSRPIGLTSLSLSVSTSRWIHTDSKCVSDLLEFIALFPRLQRLSLEFNPLDEHEHFPEFSRRLQLQDLRYLGIIGVQCTEGELVALLLRHKDTLEEAYFSLVDIISGGGSWQALLATVRDELLVPVLEMNECRSGDEAVYYRDSERDDAIHLDTFEIGWTGIQDWTNTINDLVIGDKELVS
ncbi:hypothetical protein C8A05DRAFT_20508 [Staphylotrichum tortipilum]|uniref:F-box domain-containing protein n=1 Tax=Staphylotrichum tortipilum TaxID=2831512 RepID=A0AAN6RNN4_9PEZI|nr:hypothetical protein C8A05DRAFT_20508 [Staphylotrichum longicolle]